MRPGLLLSVSFSAVTVMAGKQEGHPAHKNPIPPIPEVLYRNR